MATHADKRETRQPGARGARGVATDGPGLSPFAALTPETVIAMQRTAGNRATTALLARVPDPPDGGAPSPTPTTGQSDAGAAPSGGVNDLGSAVAEHRWADAVRKLHDMPAPDRVAFLQNLQRSDLEPLRDQAATMGADYLGVRDAAEAARVRRLGLDWQAAVAGGSWADAVTLVQAYNDLDLPAKLGELDIDQITALCQQADRMLPAYQRVRTTAEPIRIAKLILAYTAAVNAPDYPRAALLLNAFNDADIETRVNALPAVALEPMRTAGTAQLGSWGTRVVLALNKRLVADRMQTMADPAAPQRATWYPSGNDPSATDFSGWAMAATEKPFNVDPATHINCWEMVLYAAFKAGALGWAWIHAAYTAAGPDWDAQLAARLTPRGARTYDRATKLPAPARGDIVLFDGISHVALATGASDAGGTHVWSFWPPPDVRGGPGTLDRVKDVTIESLLPICDRLSSAGRCVVTFGNPPW